VKEEFGGGSSTLIALIDRHEQGRAQAVGQDRFAERQGNAVESVFGLFDHRVYTDDELHGQKAYPALPVSSVVGRAVMLRHGPVLTRHIVSTLSSQALASEERLVAFQAAIEAGVPKDPDEERDELQYNDKLQELFNQSGPMALCDQMIVMHAAAHHSLLAAVETEDMRDFETELIAHVATSHPTLYSQLNDACTPEKMHLALPEALRNALDRVVDDFFSIFPVSRARTRRT
jgi:F0F1-type ATP synthase alpha subunit